MGLCTPVTPCAICHSALGESVEVVGFPDLVPMFSDFGDFYDSCAHQACMKKWLRRDEFVEYFNSLVDASPLSDS